MARLSAVPVNMMVVSTAPTAPAIRAGDLEYNVDAEQLRIWNGSDWVDIGQPVTSTLPDGSVTSSKFSIGGLTDNLLRNPMLEDLNSVTGFPLSWTLDETHNGAGTFDVVSGGDAIAGTKTLIMRASASKQMRITQDVLCTPGDTYALSAVARFASGVSVANAFGLFVTWLDVIGNEISSSTVQTFTVTTAITRFSTPSFMAPQEARQMRVIAMALTPAAGRDMQVDSLSLRANSTLSFGTTVSTSNVGDASSAGTAVEAARADHVHGREAQAAIPFSNSLPNSAGAATAGVAGTASRSDHAHGAAVPKSFIMTVIGV